ncbi:uncharacterized protein FA14DRAFT_117058 [Meira miltonrushii]|uniref:Dihydroorotate dehydrogenase (quinone), mitochondrial n=1 Tax=Meira miltonrushii TaxID=1280837 RepID=A0A316VK90_9BASI|nr:uncharacterized protein FA14DRAFT_117058 [Meira miltonrushii]PWN38002.1 hypothetical protein FA14DRAFT_117058 [Meira miltonrushii]
MASTPLRSHVTPIASRTLFTRSKPRPVRTTIKWALLAFGLTFGVAYHLDSRSAIHRWIAIPILQTVTDAETAQKLAVKLLSLGIMPRDLGTDDEVLATSVAGLSLKNPIGLAAGFDKQAEAIDGLLNLGFGIVEVGSVTPEPQPGNDLPRYFRLTADHGAINRFGFNSEGHEVILHRLRDRIQRWILSGSSLAKSRIPLPDDQSRDHALLETASIDTILATDQVPKSLRPGQLLAVNLGKNKTSAPDSVDDYVKGVNVLGPYADLLVVNISSPNTPGLRGLQRKSVLSDLMSQVVEARDKLPLRRQNKVPLLVKIAPDLDENELKDIADAAVSSGVEGLIVSNTTIQRPSSLLSPSEITSETGGLSGAPLKPLSLKALQTVRKRVGDKVSIIGCGGIFSGQDALDFAKAGADAIELYTSFGYEGVGHPRRVKDELTALLKAQNTTWKAVIGTGIEKENFTTTLPSNEKDFAKVGNLSDRLGESAASIKGEIEGWRKTLGMAVADAKESIKEAQPMRFRPDPSDKEYTSLLDKVHEALGVPDSPSSDKNAAELDVSQMTQNDVQRIRLGIALQDPSVAPSVALEGAGDQATVGSGQTPTFGRIGQKLTPVDPRGASTASSSSSQASSDGRVGMGGKSDFNSVDSRRVV